MLEAPEQDYAREPATTRRTSVAPKRKLRRDLTEDFADDFPEEEDAPAGRRQRGVRLRFRWGLPPTRWGRIAAGFALLVLAGICAGAMWLARNTVMHDPRFFIQSASSIEIQGNVHLTRDELVNIFGGDLERNIFRVSLAERRAQLQQLPWVEHATVMRLLPNRLRVSIVERTPVAFVRQGSQIGLVDASGVLLDMPSNGQGDAHYSFPVVTGILASDPASTRAARMKIFEQFMSDLDSSGETISQELNEVDLSNPEDVKALIPDNGTDILVHFGDTDFLDRYRKFKEHLPEWKTQYPALSSVDMRYERQVVLEMRQGAAATTGSTSADLNTSGEKGSASGASAAAPIQPASKPVAKAVAKPHTSAHPGVKKAPVTKRKPAAKGKPHRAVAKPHSRVARHSAGPSRYHSSQVVHP